MCLGKVIVIGEVHGEHAISDVVDIAMEGAQVKVTTLFGEQHVFSGVRIEHVAMRSGVVISLGLAQ
jgi:predicted RNA-binding protein